MALDGLTPFGQQGLLDADPAGQQGRDPGQWGIPQDQSRGEPPPAAPTPVFAPGGEYGTGGSFGLHTDVVPGAGEIISVPVTGYLGPADPQWQEWQQELTAAHGDATGDEPYGLYPRTPDDGHPSAATRRLQVSDSTDQHAANATITPSFDVWRAAEMIVHNVAKTLLVPILHYSERPFYNNIAITAPETTQPGAVTIPGTGREIMSPSNLYSGTVYAYDPGVASAYEQPAEPVITSDNEAAAMAPAQGASWMSYG